MAKNHLHFFWWAQRKRWGNSDEYFCSKNVIFLVKVSGKSIMNFTRFLWDSGT